MPAQHLANWSPTVIVAAHTEMVTILSSGAAAPTLTIHDADDVLLGTITLPDPAGTVNPTTGAVTVTQQAREDSAPTEGVAAYSSLRDGDGVVHRSMPCQQGTVAVLGYCVLNSLQILQGSPVELVSLTIPGA